MDLENARDEVYRKIGRNIFILQKVEHMLKHLVSNGRVAGYASELRETRDQRAAYIHKHTLGWLVGQFVDNTFHDGEASTQEPETLKEPWVCLSFRVESDPVYCEARRQALASLVADRNELVHHLFPGFNPGSMESCSETGRFLDQQHEKILLEYGTLKTMITSMQEVQKTCAEFLISDEGKRQFELSWLRQSPLALLLGDIATEAARPDGWTLLSAAGQLIRQRAPEEMAALKDRYGHKTLKGLLLATGLFDVYEEPTHGGGVRVLYRPRPD